MKVVIPSSVNRVCQMYCNLLQKEIPDPIIGVYLYGSLVLDDFRINSSDIDFVTVVKRRLMDKEIANLEEIHLNVRSHYSKPPMNGIYIQCQELGLVEGEIEAIPYYFGGVMHKAGFFELNPVTWFELKEHGIVLFGPDLSTIDFPFKFYRVIDYIADNINSYWRTWVQKARKGRSSYSVSKLLNDNEVEWGVLGVSRQYYTLKEKGICSKSQAGEYAFVNVPEQWKRIIQEALEIRRGIKGTSYMCFSDRTTDVLNYMDFIILECNKLLSTESKGNSQHRSRDS